MRAIDYILLDLDGTLIHIDQASFLKAYMGEIGAAFGDVCDPGRFVAEVWHATEAVMESQDTSKTNQEVFFDVFLPRIGKEAQELMPRLERFYLERFPRLRSHAEPHPQAREVATSCMDKGYGVVIATNPLFPREAIMERLRWAGVADLPFELVTTYENMHFCKPSPGYFKEIADRLGAEPGRCVMVGDDLPLDLIGADAVGMVTYHVTAGAHDSCEIEPDGRGDLPDLLEWLEG